MPLFLTFFFVRIYYFIHPGKQTQFQLLPSVNNSCKFYKTESSSPNFTNSTPQFCIRQFNCSGLVAGQFFLVNFTLAIFNVWIEKKICSGQVVRELKMGSFCQCAKNQIRSGEEGTQKDKIYNTSWRLCVRLHSGAEAARKNRQVPRTVTVCSSTSQSESKPAPKSILAAPTRNRAPTERAMCRHQCSTSPGQLALTFPPF